MIRRPGPGERSQLEEIAWACCLALMGLVVGARIVLREIDRATTWGAE